MRMYIKFVFLFILPIFLLFLLGGCTFVVPDGMMAGMPSSTMDQTTPITDTSATSMMTGMQMITGTQMSCSDMCAGMMTDTQMSCSDTCANMMSGTQMSCSDMCAGMMSGTQMMTGTQMTCSDMCANMMSGTQMMTGTQSMTSTQMGGMDHSQMNMDSTKPFDAQFIDGMIEHHQGAIDMAQQALEQAEHEELRTLAETIIAAQNTEIEQMQTWRTEWYADLPATGGMEMGMGDMMISDDASIPFDQRFISAMISHHQGAIDMADMAKQMAEHPEIEELADAIITAQQAEIAQMQQWEQEWFAGSQ